MPPRRKAVAPASTTNTAKRRKANIVKEDPPSPSGSVSSESETSALQADDDGAADPVKAPAKPKKKPPVKRAPRMLQQPRLTERQKKANHIASEKKRREAIRAGFDRISEVVPGLEGLARSEGHVLVQTVKYLQDETEKRRALLSELAALGHNIDTNRSIEAQLMELKLIPMDSTKFNEDGTIPLSHTGVEAGRAPSATSSQRRKGPSKSRSSGTGRSSAATSVKASSEDATGQLDSLHSERSSVDATDESLS
ncbi:MAG: hypothetical protein M1814_000838 [Vezdaea aestivalis]|nr:MAG: hypothetical protein M1814_000838 [Vezdaea aestivalis]